MRIDIPTEGIEELIASLGFDDAKNVLTGRAMSAAQRSINSLMEQYAERREARQRGRIVGNPASTNNLSRPSDPPPIYRTDLNYFAPKKNLQVLLSEEWFDKVSMDKKRFTVVWRNFYLRRETFGKNRELLIIERFFVESALIKEYN